MAAVQVLPAQPRRQGSGEGQPTLRTGWYTHSSGHEIVDDLHLARVREAPAMPLIAHAHAVGTQGFLVTAPHAHNRMMLPPVVGPRKRPHDLQRLDTLLAQSPVVEHGSRRFEIGIGKKGLHALRFSTQRWLFPPAFRLAFWFSVWSAGYDRLITRERHLRWQTEPLPRQ